MPLGFWGFKDLRLHNPHPFSVWFKLTVLNGALIGEVHSELPLRAHQVEFIRIPLASPMVQVDTTLNGQLLQSTTYEQRQGIQVSA